MYNETAVKLVFKIYLPILVLIALVVGTLLIVRSQIDSKGEGGHHQEFKVGDTVPDFVLNEIKTQKSYPVSTLFKTGGRKVILLNFWATWCQACLDEIPSIIALKDKFEPTGFGVALINLDDTPEQRVSHIARRLKLGFTTYHDGDQKLGTLFGVTGIPYTVLLDRNLKILLIETGDRDWNSTMMQNKVEEWLSQ